MASFDQTAAAPILKTRYPSKKILTQAYKKSPLLGMIPKFNDFGGDFKVFPTKYSRPQGRSHNFSTAQANKTGSTYARFQLTRVKDYSTASIDGETIKACKGDANALVDAITSELDGAIASASESAQVSLYRNGGGARGRMTAGSVIAGPTITLTDAADIVHFEVGQWVQLSATDGTSGAVKPGHVQISALDRDAGTLTTAGGNWNAQIPTAAVSDYIFSDGDFGGMMSGLDAWLPVAAPGVATFFGVNRSTDTTRLGGIRFNGNGGPIDEVLIEAAARAVREHASPDVVFINNLDFSPLIKQLGTKREYVTADSTMAGIGYRAVQIETDAGAIKVVPDPYCPHGTAFMLQLDTWELCSLDDLPHILDLDGNRFLREAGADAYEIRVGYYGNLGCYAPGWNVRITL